MATFPIANPVYNTRITPKPSVNVVSFGDGFEQRLMEGLNQNPKVFNLTWKHITETDSDTIETFLDARAVDGASFTYTPPNEPSAMQFKCQNWSKLIDKPNRPTIEATFTEVFEP